MSWKICHHYSITTEALWLTGEKMLCQQNHFLFSFKLHCLLCYKKINKYLFISILMRLWGLIKAQRSNILFYGVWKWEIRSESVQLLNGTENSAIPPPPRRKRALGAHAFLSTKRKTDFRLWFPCNSLWCDNDKWHNFGDTPPSSQAYTWFKEELGREKVGGWFEETQKFGHFLFLIGANIIGSLQLGSWVDS